MFASILLGDGAGNFAHALDVNVGSNPFVVAVGDFNSDGKQDLVVTNFFSHNVSIVLGDGAGHFGARASFGVGEDPAAVAVGDFNGDGQQDLAVANFLGGSITLFLRDCLQGTTPTPTPSCAILTALANDGSTSTLAPAPSARYANSRAVYLIRASELAANGVLSGNSPTSLGWNYQTAPGVAGAAPLKIYLQNTADTTYGKGLSFSAAIAGMTTVHNATTTLPGTAGPFDIALSGGSPSLTPVAAFTSRMTGATIPGPSRLLP